MNCRIIFAVVGVGAVTLITPPASAVYLGLQVLGQRVTLQNGALMNRYRVYGYFSDPNDYLTGVAGSPNLGNLVIQSRNADDTGFGSNFYNPPGGGPTAPSLDVIAQSADVAHDTFVTIGISIAEQGTSGIPGEPDVTKLSPGFAGIGNVNQLNSNMVGWVAGPSEQGRAGWLGDGDPLLRVLMMQLTVSSTSNVRGTVQITGVNNNPLAGATAFTVTGQTFNSIPAPGILPLLGLAALIARRRCRRAYDTSISPRRGDSP